MDYEKKDFRKLYEDLVKSDWFKRAYHNKSLGECPFDIPELVESEDERIRKRLIEYFEGFRMGNAEVKWEGLTVQEVLAWLEKREEQKPVEHSAKSRRGRMGGIPEYVRRKAEAFKDKMEPPYDADDICTAYEAGALESAKPAELEQLAKLREMTHEIRDAYKRGIEVGRVESKQEWSEADEEMLDAMIDIVSNSLYEPLCPREGMLAWLKTLPERFNLEPKEGWNEEDEENMQAIVETIKRHWLTLPGNTLIDWLKSLRPVSKESLQPHWKPSEEQMESLAYAIQVLNSNPHPKSAKAYQDLQTLYKNIKYGN